MDDHHTPEQVLKAFAHAPIILSKLIDAGVSSPYFELFADASGRLCLGQDSEKIPVRHVELAQNLLHSARPYQMFCDLCFDPDNNTKHSHTVGVTFCCGLVTAAEEI